MQVILTSTYEPIYKISATFELPKKGEQVPVLYYDCNLEKLFAISQKNPLGLHSTLKAEVADSFIVISQLQFTEPTCFILLSCNQVLANSIERKTTTLVNIVEIKQTTQGKLILLISDPLP